MNPENEHYFNLLKEKVSYTFLEEHSVPQSIRDWKGEDITLFQEDLFVKVKAKVSEKWFYTYFKKEPEKLPRIDMLNLLSTYVGYTNWNDFKVKHKQLHKKPNTKQRILWSLFAIAFLVVAVINPFGKNEFQFCFIDEDKGESIKNVAINIMVFQENESPLHFTTDSSGCFSYTTKEDKIMFSIESPYHKADTIVRHINSNKNQIVKLITDDYALMLDYYTNGKLEDWEQRKKELQKLIADDAKIYQMFSNNIGVEIYSKNDFIRMLTIPTQSLKRIEILDKELKNGKIVKLKFMVL